MQEMFLVVFAHCSGGHGDTFSVKGVYFHLETALDVARDVEKEHLTMTGMDHGAFIYRLGLNKTYNARSGEHFVFALRYHRDGTWGKEWFDENLHHSSPVNAEELRQRVIDQL